MTKLTKTLEILIPTYGRPQSAEMAINSCLDCNDERILVSCNSNGYEPSLEYFRDYDARLHYSCFNANQGVHANFLYLIKNARARYCMLLSDEDLIDPHGLKLFLDFLDSCPSSYKVITCTIFDPAKNSYYFKNPNKILSKAHDINAVCAFFLIPSYISGLTYNSEALRSLPLEYFFDPGPWNAYPHLDVAYNLLLDGFMYAYGPKCVIKGRDVEFGGDGYSHRSSLRYNKTNNADLNPKIYGPYPRALQFYHREKKYYDFRVKLKLKPLYYLLAQINLIFWFSHFIINSHNTVIISEDSVLGAVKSAREDSPKINRFSNSFFSNAFIKITTSPKWIYIPLVWLKRLFLAIALRVYFIKS